MKKTLIVCAVGVLSLSVLMLIQSVAHREMSIMDFNVEALASPEGTKIKDCHIAGSGSSGFKLECPRNTSSSVIYPCPHSDSFIYSEIKFYCVDE